MSPIGEVFFLFGGAALGISIGAIYLARAESTSSLALRLATAAYAPALAVLLVVAGFMWPEQYRFNAAGKQAYLWLQVAPCALLVLSLLKYPGPKRLHLIVVPLAVVAWLWTFALGFMAVNGK
jgi:hypothetical protein